MHQNFIHLTRVTLFSNRNIIKKFVTFFAEACDQFFSDDTEYSFPTFESNMKSFAQVQISEVFAHLDSSLGGNTISSSLVPNSWKLKSQLQTQELFSYADHRA